MIDIGESKLVTKMDKKFGKSEYFPNIIYPYSLQKFELLKVQNATQAMNASSDPELCKRYMSPILTCMLHKSDIFIIIFKDFDDLFTPAQEILKQKFPVILRRVLKTQDLTGFFFQALVFQRDRKSSENINSLIESFRKFVRQKGGLVKRHYSDNLCNMIIQSQGTLLLREFYNDLDMDRIVFILMKKMEAKNFGFEVVKEISDATGYSLNRLLIEVVFYPQQDAETIPTLMKIQKKILENLNTTTFANKNANGFKQQLLLRLNKIMPNAQIVKKSNLPVPKLFMPFLLDIILRMKNSGIAKPWELYVELIKLLIKARKHNEADVWNGILRFAKFDKYMTENILGPMLPLEDRERLINEIM